MNNERPRQLTDAKEHQKRFRMGRAASAEAPLVLIGIWQTGRLTIFMDTRYLWRLASTVWRREVERRRHECVHFIEHPRGPGAAAPTQGQNIVAHLDQQVPLHTCNAHLESIAPAPATGARLFNCATSAGLSLQQCT